MDKSSQIVDMNENIPADEEVLKAMQTYQDQTLKYVGTKIGTATGDFLGTEQTVKETALMDLINEVQRTYAGTDLSIAAPLSSSVKILKGDITIQDLMGVYVFENYLYGIKMTGKQLKDWMEWSVRYYSQVKSPSDPITKDKELNIPDYNLDQLYGASYTIDLTEPAGNRIKNLSVNGKPVKDTDLFTVAINNYRFNGGGGFMKAAGITNPEVVFDSAKVYGDDGQVRNLMIRYIQEKKSISPTVAGYWTISTSGVAEPKPQPAPVPQPAPTPQPQPVPQPAPTPQPQPAPSAKIGKVATFALNVRTGPGAKHPVSFVLHQGNEVIVGETKYGWVKVTYDNKTGYVYAAYLLLPSSAVQGKSGIVNVDFLNVRSDATPNGKIIGVVKKGEVLTILGEKAGWYQIKFGDKKAYVYGKYVTR